MHDYYILYHAILANKTFISRQCALHRTCVHSKGKKNRKSCFTVLNYLKSLHLYSFINDRLNELKPFQYLISIFR